MHGYIIHLTSYDDHVTAACDELDIKIHADTREHAMANITAYIDSEVTQRIKEGKDIPRSEYKDGEYTYLYDIDKILKDQSTEMVRRSISLPMWLDNRIKNSGLDSSKIFREAILKELVPEDRGITTIKDLEENIDEELLKSYVMKYLSANLFK